MAFSQSTFWQGLVTLLTILPALAHKSDAGSNPPSTSPSGLTTSLPRLAGVNMAGIEFGAQNDGTYSPNAVPVYPPITQIPHFIKQNVNVIRVPVAWDYLQATANAKLNSTNVESYRAFIEEITSKGAFAIIDVHSYGRYQGQIVGEKIPASVLTSLWTQLGAVFKDNKLVMFGISNEPHDQDINMWAKTVQEVVTALRGGPNPIKNVILVPGIEYTSMKAFLTWYKVMKSVKNPDGSFDDILFEVHRYLDSDNSGKSTECVASHADEVKQVVEMLKPDNRQVILAEIGGGNTESCEKFLPEIIGAVVDAFPTFVGFAMWAAGAFDAKYELVVTVANDTSPTGWTDQRNWRSIQKFLPTNSTTPAKVPKKRTRTNRCRA